mgnify:CR=1 FL=1
MPQQFVHDPQAVLDYAWDWSTWLEPGETITTATITTPTGLALASQSIAGGRVVAWLCGGEPRTRYRVTCHITTDRTREDDRTLVLWCDHR